MPHSEGGWEDLKILMKPTILVEKKTKKRVAASAVVHPASRLKKCGRIFGK